MYLHIGAQKATVAPAGCSHGASSIGLGPGSAGSAGAIFCGLQNSHYPVLDFTRTLLWSLAAAKTSALNHANRPAFSWCSEDPGLEMSVPVCYAFHHQPNRSLFPQGGLLSPDLLALKDLFRHTHTISAETGSKATWKRQSYIHMSRGHTK